MTLYMHLVTLVLASTAGAACFVAVWAAESRRHWFWRALAVWLCVATMLPIRAYEPALVFSISLPITALAIRAIAWTGEQRISTADGAIDQFSTFRFGLRDALLVMALLGYGWLLPYTSFIEWLFKAIGFEPRSSAKSCCPRLR